jgi:hypothetical protein
MDGAKSDGCDDLEKQGLCSCLFLSNCLHVYTHSTEHRSEKALHTDYDTLSVMNI